MLESTKNVVEAFMETLHDSYSDYSLSAITHSQKTRPDSREKLLKMGSDILSNQELMMILLGTGSEKTPVRKLAGKVLNVLKTCERDDVVEKLLAIDGIGPSKSCLISAALELGRRLNSGPGSKIYSPVDIIPFIQHIALEKQEHFLCVTLNGAHEILSIRTISVGTLNRCIIHPREVYAEALMERCAAIILAHNHPSGNTEPSENDIEITQQLYEVSKIVGIHILDHIVVCSNAFFSFAENGLVFCN